jgi:pimeloyl-ACP methyl ester carboxylesterase
MQTTTDTSQNRLSFRTRGEGQTALLLMHGWAGSGSYFDGMVEHLDPDLVYSITFDLPGHGGSPAPSDHYNLDLVADAAIAVADAAGADTFVLVGFSMSGKFAQYVTCRHPDRVLGQILVAGCPAGPLPLPRDMVEDWYARAGSAEGLIDVALSCASRPISRDVLEDFGREAARVPEPLLRETLELCAESSFSEEVAGSPVPTLVVAGRDDWLFSPDMLRETVVSPLGRARLETLDCGHEIPVEAPRVLADLVAHFVLDLRPTQPAPATAGAT